MKFFMLLTILFSASLPLYAGEVEDVECDAIVDTGTLDDAASGSGGEGSSGATGT